MMIERGKVIDMKKKKRQIPKPAGQHRTSHNGNHGNNYRAVLGRGRQIRRGEKEMDGGGWGWGGADTTQVL